MKKEHTQKIKLKNTKSTHERNEMKITKMHTKKN